MKLPFTKYHRGGNDFILIDDRKQRFADRDGEYIAHLCDRKRGIGADGLILYQSFEGADGLMRIFNADGSEAAMCGNGLLCLLSFLQQLQIPLTFRSIATLQRKWAVCSGENLVGFEIPSPPSLDIRTDILPGHAVYMVDTGVPHAVLFLNSPPADSHLLQAPAIRHHATFAPEGVNVNFAYLSAPHKLELRTYERGIEGETLSCGSGAAAAAWVARHLYPDRLDPELTVQELLIRFTDTGLSLLGHPTRVFDGHL